VRDARPSAPRPTVRRWRARPSSGVTGRVPRWEEIAGASGLEADGLLPRGPSPRSCCRACWRRGAERPLKDPRPPRATRPPTSSLRTTSRAAAVLRAAGRSGPGSGGSPPMRRSSPRSCARRRACRVEPSCLADRARCPPATYRAALRANSLSRWPRRSRSARRPAAHRLARGRGAGRALPRPELQRAVRRHYVLSDHLALLLVALRGGAGGALLRAPARQLGGWRRSGSPSARSA
jgi:hypothetical protein